MIAMNLIKIMIILPIIGGFWAFFFWWKFEIHDVWINDGIHGGNYNRDNRLRNGSLFFTGFNFLISLFILLILNKTEPNFQAVFLVSFWNLNIRFGIDFISLSLIILTNLFIFLCILNLRIGELYGKFDMVEILFLLYFLQWGLLCAFSVLNLLGFFIFFEATLVPIFLIILLGGSRERKTRAGTLIALYTLAGSIFMLFNIIYVYVKFGSTDYVYLLSLQFSELDQKILWLTFFLAFAAKIPVFPLHVWIPEAHVEAPTIGSVILAALLLKLGVYGLIRYGLPLFPYGQEYFKHTISALTLCSFLYTNIAAIRQVDIKKIVAYSSVAHMNLVVLGILCISIESLDGAIFQMIAHGLVSGALFFCIGILYERFSTRLVWYVSGVAFYLPLFSFYFFIFNLGNISFPGSSNFIGEILLYIGIFKDNFFFGTLATISMFFGAIYTMWTYNRICFGNIKLFTVKPIVTKDIDKLDFVILFTLLFFLFLTGFYSGCILNYISINTTSIITRSINIISQTTQFTNITNIKWAD